MDIIEILTFLYNIIKSFHPIVQIALVSTGVIIFLILKLKPDFKGMFQIFQKKKIICNECILSIMRKREAHDIKVQRIRNSIITTQMNFTKLKLERLSYEIVTNILSKMSTKRNPNDKIDYSKENKERTIIKEILKNAINNIKDELERSFIENGYYHLDNTRLDIYVNGKKEDILTIIKDYITMVYPYDDMYLSIEEVIDVFNNLYLFDIIVEIYYYSKEVYTSSMNEITRLDNEYLADISKQYENK